jgi:hypothetical protein
MCSNAWKNPASIRQFANCQTPPNYGQQFVSAKDGLNSKEGMDRAHPGAGNLDTGNGWFSDKIPYSCRQHI